MTTLPCVSDLQCWRNGDPNVVIRAVLAQSAYGTEATSSQEPKPTLWDQIWRWFLGCVRAVFEQLALLFHGASGARITLALIFLAVGVGTLLILIARVLRAVGHRHRPRQGGPPSQVLVQDRDSAAWFLLSGESAAQERYGVAIAGLFMAALRLLDERGVAAFDAARTPNEYRELIACGLAAASAPFDLLATRFVCATYAKGLPFQVEYEAAARAYAAFASMLP